MFPAPRIESLAQAVTLDRATPGFGTHSTAHHKYQNLNNRIRDSRIRQTPFQLSITLKVAAAPSREGQEHIRESRISSSRGFRLNQLREVSFEALEILCVSAGDKTTSPSRPRFVRITSLALSNAILGIFCLGGFAANNLVGWLGGLRQWLFFLLYGRAQQEHIHQKITYENCNPRHWDGRQRARHKTGSTRTRSDNGFAYSHE